MDDAEETVTLRRLSDTDLAAGSWAESRLGDPDPGGGPAVDAAAGLASLSFITLNNTLSNASYDFGKRCSPCGVSSYAK